MASVPYVDEDYADVSTYLRGAYEGVLQRIDVPSALTLDFGAGRLRSAVRRWVDRSADSLMPAKAAERWLISNVGRLDDPLRRAAVAALALGLKPDVGSLPIAVLELYPDMHLRLARFLTGAHAYDADLFAKDIALAAGASAPAGALTIAVPSASAPRLSLPRVRRDLAAFRRQFDQSGAREAFDWLAGWGARPWVELHVDTRNLGEFHREGFIRCYHRLADLMALRSDLAGVYGASWLYQPELSAISPKLAFARETAEAGGGRLVRLRADPVQTAFAVARSPDRRRLMMSGRYRPVCYGMFWRRDALIEWSRSERAGMAGRQTAGSAPDSTSSSDSGPTGRRRR
jgi:hypothetical protein